jgi:hypothetical protein
VPAFGSRTDAVFGNHPPSCCPASPGTARTTLCLRRRHQAEALRRRSAASLFPCCSIGPGLVRAPTETDPRAQETAAVTFALLRTIAFLAIACAAVPAATAQKAHVRQYYPKDIQPLIDREIRWNELCRGGIGEDPQGPTCRRRDRLVRQLERRGWCHGSRNRDAAEFQMTWLPCTRDRTR